MTRVNLNISLEKLVALLKCYTQEQHLEDFVYEYKVFCEDLLDHNYIPEVKE